MTTSIAALLLSATVGAGCGGGGDSSTSVANTATAPPTISKAEFIRRANAACREQRAGLKQRVAKFERLRDGKKPTAYADMVHFVFLPTIEQEIRGIESAGRPAGEKERLRVLLAAERTAIDAVAVTPRVPSIKSAESHFAKSRRMFRAYGLTACAIG